MLTSDRGAIWSGRALALLDLEWGIDVWTAKRAAPVFLGDFDEAVEAGVLDATNALMVGFGSPCVDMTCLDDDDFVYRRAGRVSGTVELQTGEYGEPQLTAELEPSAGAVKGTGNGILGAPVGDYGGPLFVWNTVSRRYVLVGTFVNGPGYTGLSFWSYTGRRGNAPDQDHGAWLQPLLGADDDGDGIVDRADNCPPSYCTAHGLPATACSNPDQADSDGNQLGNVCCFADLRATPRNSNVEAERALGADEIPDVCDPVPLVRMSSRKPTLSSVDPGKIYFRGQAWVGDGTYDSYFQEDIGYRYCPCYNQHGQEADEGTCVADICDAGAAVDAAIPFVAIDVVRDRDPSQQIPVLGTGGFALGFYVTQPGNGLNFTWDWLTDYSLGIIEGRIKFINGARVETTHGLLASAVIKNGTFFSDRDEAFDGNLRADLQFQSVQGPEDHVVLDDRPFVASACVANPFACFGPIMPWEEWLWQVTGIRHHPEEALLVHIDQATGMPYGMARWDAPYRIDFGAAVGDVSAWTYPDAASPWPYVGSTESLAFLQQQGVTGRAMRVAPETVSATEAYAVYNDGDGPFLDGAPPMGLMMTFAAPESAADFVRIPRDGEAVFSAYRRTLFLVGGSDLAPEERIRRYDVEAQALETVDVDPISAPSTLVLGAAYDSVEDALYVLDADGGTARLVVHAFGEGVSRQLWQTSHSGDYSSVFLGQMEDGKLALVVTDSSSYSAWAIDVAGEQAAFAGRIDGIGSPLNRPGMGLHSLTLPVLRDDGVHYVQLAAGTFEEGAACSGL